MNPTAKSATLEIQPLGVREFDLLRAYIRSVSGIELSSKKMALVESRLNRRLLSLGLRSFREYYIRLLQDDDSECQNMLDRITTNETSFFREPAQFELLEEVVIPRWKEQARGKRRRKHIRVWSAGCSTGEEPYSVGMCLLHALPRTEGWNIEIIASDISLEVLEQASHGVYSVDQTQAIPTIYRDKFMLRGRGPQSGKVKVGTDLHASVRFGRFNLSASHYRFRQPFDLILCRNVLIYFGRDEKMGAVHRMLDLLVPDGLFMLGHAESLQGQTERVRSVRPTVYSLTDAPLFSTDAGQPEDTL
ncbi:MAG: protein-glutamate O-methyltransferase CheR [Myxococcales bacterium]|nr:protein-glutamate O-methyltransferase CheR [Myxococcales bacterium]